MKKEDNVGVEDVHNDDNQDGEGCSSFLVVRETIEREQMRYVALDEGREKRVVTGQKIRIQRI